jgi:hypothetical protein
MTFVLNKSVVTDLQAKDKEAKSAAVSGIYGDFSLNLLFFKIVLISYRETERSDRM